MKPKLFISYSHQDGNHKKSFEKHLSALKNNGSIEAWSDTKIPAGGNIDREVDSNLVNSDIIIHLVSPDFISSDYCYNIEAKKAREMHDSGEAVQIAVIVESCMWKELDYLQGNKALPNDGVCIAKWPNPNDGWLNVMEHIKEAVEEIKEKNQLIATENVAVHIDSAFNDWLNDTEIRLCHKNKEHVFLSDVYVWPDIQTENDDINRQNQFLTSESLADSSLHTLIIGDEQSGKTALCKNLYLAMKKKGLFPVYLNGQDIKKHSIEALIERSIKSQYGDKSIAPPKNSVVVILDDLHISQLRENFKDKLLESLKTNYGRIIITSDESIRFLMQENKLPSIDAFSKSSIMNFGVVKRNALIEKWVCMGQEETMPEGVIYKESDAKKVHLDSIIGKNIVPSKPFFILTILQSIDTFSGTRLEQTSYGHCYDYLIISALKNSKIREDKFDSHINYLTELAFYFFKSKKSVLDDDELEKFYSMYDKEYHSTNSKEILENLMGAEILSCDIFGTFFKYKYTYYFYVAKYLAENIRQESTRDLIKSILEYSHREENANILVFITHHTKDSFVLDEIQYAMIELFGDFKPATLNPEETAFMRDIINEIPKLVIQNKDHGKERRAKLEKEEAHREQSSAMEEEIEKLEPNDILARINRTIKLIEISGQITRNRQGSLKKAILTCVIKEAYESGLRFLSYYLNLVSDGKGEIIKYIEKAIMSDPNSSTDDIEREARRNFLMITYGVIWGILRKISYSVGSADAKALYDSIKSDLDTPAVKLINLMIELLFSNVLDVKEIKKLNQELSSNLVAQRILKESVIQHMYMYPIDFDVKQKLSAALDIPITQQKHIAISKNKALVDRK